MNDDTIGFSMNTSSSMPRIGTTLDRDMSKQRIHKTPGRDALYLE
jgi:hypothetical protein